METPRFDSPEEFFKHLKKVTEEIREKVTLFRFKSTLLEEELVAVLNEMDPQEAGLSFFVNIGIKYYEDEAWELLNVIKTYIEYNFDVELITKKGITQYEIRKRS